MFRITLVGGIVGRISTSFTADAGRSEFNNRAEYFLSGNDGAEQEATRSEEWLRRVRGRDACNTGRGPPDVNPQ